MKEASKMLKRKSPKKKKGKVRTSKKQAFIENFVVSSEEEAVEEKEGTFAEHMHVRNYNVSHGYYIRIIVLICVSNN